jgi:membrane protease YdiL (CAAX protease family)
MKQNTILNQMVMFWSHVPLIVRAVLTGFVVSSIGIAIWSLMLSGIVAPWSILPMIVALWAYLKFFGGSWGPKKQREVRKTRFRAIKLSPFVWKWGITAAFLFVIIVQASFVITFRIIDFPAEKFTADYKTLENMPLWVAWPVLIMSSIVAGVCEETGFRGYLQVPIEKKYGPSMGIIITSVIFMLIHLSHSWASPILPHIFFASVLLGILAYKTGSLIPGIIGHSILDIFDYSVWWSDISGGFHKQTIFKTGIDIHFIIWCLIFILAVFVFFRSMGRLKKRELQLANMKRQTSIKNIYS